MIDLPPWLIPETVYERVQQDLDKRHKEIYNEPNVHHFHIGGSWQASKVKKFVGLREMHKHCRNWSLSNLFEMLMKRVVNTRREVRFTVTVASKKNA